MSKQITKRLENDWHNGASPLQIVEKTTRKKDKPQVLRWLTLQIENDLPSALEWVDVPFILSTQFELLRDGCKNIKVRNKRTGKCVKLNGVIGKRILTAAYKKNVEKESTRKNGTTVAIEDDIEDGYVTPDEIEDTDGSIEEALAILFTPVKPRIVLSDQEIKKYTKEVISNAQVHGGAIWNIVQQSLSLFQTLLRSNANGDLMAVFTLMCFQIVLQAQAKQEDASILVTTLHYILRPLISDRFLVWTNIFYFLSKAVPGIEGIGKATQRTYSWIYLAKVMIRILLYIWKNFFVVAGTLLKNGELSKGL